MKTRQKGRSSRLFHPHPDKGALVCSNSTKTCTAESTCLQTTTTATTLATSRVGRDGGDILDSADSHAGTGEGTEGGLGTGTGGLGAVTTSGADLDVQGINVEFLAAGGNILGGQHGGVGRGLVTVSLDLHTTGDTGHGFATAVFVSFLVLCLRAEYANLRSVTWTKVSLKEAKMRATPKLSLPVLISTLSLSLT